MVTYPPRRRVYQTKDSEDIVQLKSNELKKEGKKKMLIDLSHLIQDGLPVFPGDSETVLQQSNKEEYEQFIKPKQIVILYTGHSKYLY